MLTNIKYEESQNGKRFLCLVIILCIIVLVVVGSTVIYVFVARPNQPESTTKATILAFEGSGLEALVQAPPEDTLLVTTPTTSSNSSKTSEIQPQTRSDQNRKTNS